ncbi:MAG: hypothetical protein LBE72_04460, partial [Rickettsia sp.]|nr:hypothetical protein [Rickettsia sp.]
MVLFNKLQNNFLINISNRYLVTRCIIFLFLFILFFLLQGFGTSNVLAAGVNNVENELEEIQQTINKAYGELERLKHEYNSHTVNYSEEVELLEADYLTLLDSQKEYSSKKNMIEEKISDNETLKDIKEKGLILINQLIDEGQKKYYSDEVQTNDDKNSLVELETYLIKKEAELKQSSCQDDVTSILKDIGVSLEDLENLYSDKTQKDPTISLNKVNKNLERTKQYIDEIEKKEMPLLLREKDNY